jgi:hypothetical protein
MKNEGALKMRFLRHGGINRSDVSSHLVNPGRGPACRSGPGQAIGRAGRNTPCPIVRDEFRPAIPQRVARQHCPPPLHRHHQLKSIAASKGIIYHRTVTSLLTVCLSPGDNPTLKRQQSKVEDLQRQIESRKLEAFKHALGNAPRELDELMRQVAVKASEIQGIAMQNNRNGLDLAMELFPFDLAGDPYSGMAPYRVTSIGIFNLGLRLATEIQGGRAKAA